MVFRSDTALLPDPADINLPALDRKTRGRFIRELKGRLTRETAVSRYAEGFARLENALEQTAKKIDITIQKSRRVSTHLIIDDLVPMSYERRRNLLGLLFSYRISLLKIMSTVDELRFDRKSDLLQMFRRHLTVLDDGSRSVHWLEREMVNASLVLREQKPHQVRPEDFEGLALLSTELSKATSWRMAEASEEAKERGKRIDKLLQRTLRRQESLSKKFAELGIEA